MCLSGVKRRRQLCYRTITEGLFVTVRCEVAAHYRNQGAMETAIWTQFYTNKSAALRYSSPAALTNKSHPWTLMKTQACGNQALQCYRPSHHCLIQGLPGYLLKPCSVPPTHCATCVLGPHSLETEEQEMEGVHVTHGYNSEVMGRCSLGCSNTSRAW